jgi:protein-tyrosine phosphatase
MIDFHCHLLPGLDDGPQSVNESLEMARALATFGFREVHCTPHCIAGQYEISPVEVREAVRKLQARLDLEGLALTLRTGMEYYLDEYFERFAANLLPLGESRLVLCEAPPQAPPGLVSEMASLIVVQGFVPLIAHPERSDVVWQMVEGDAVRDTRQAERGQAKSATPEPQAPNLLCRLFPFLSRKPQTADIESPSTNDSSFSTHRSVLVSSSFPEETLFQANLGAFAGFYGPLAQRRAYELLKRGVYCCFASDLHEARAAAELLEQAREKLAFNPVLRKLGDFKPPQGEGGDGQLGFW